MTLSKKPAEVVGLVLAAGLSTRMGEPKLVLPWGKATVIEQVVQTLQTAGLQRAVVVTGGWRKEIEAALEKFRKDRSVIFAHNPKYEAGEMLGSIQTGINGMPHDAQAAFIALGDQPGIETQVVRAILDAYIDERPRLVVPSFRHRRGHPWIVDRRLWAAILNLEQDQTMRDFFYDQEADIRYVEVNTPTIRQDLDTPEDYAKYRPE